MAVLTLAFTWISHPCLTTALSCGRWRSEEICGKTVETNGRLPIGGSGSPTTGALTTFFISLTFPPLHPDPPQSPPVAPAANIHLWTSLETKFPVFPPRTVRTFSLPTTWPPLQSTPRRGSTRLWIPVDHLGRLWSLVPQPCPRSSGQSAFGSFVVTFKHLKWASNILKLLAFSLHQIQPTHTMLPTCSGVQRRLGLLPVQVLADANVDWNEPKSTARPVTTS